MLIWLRYTDSMEDDSHCLAMAVSVLGLVGHPKPNTNAGTRYRLVADGSQDGDTYECHYIFGLSSNVPQDVAQLMLAIDNTAQIWREKVQKSRQPGTDLFHSVSVILFPATDLAEQVGKLALPESKFPDHLSMSPSVRDIQNPEF